MWIALYENLRIISVDKIHTPRQIYVTDRFFSEAKSQCQELGLTGVTVNLSRIAPMFTLILHRRLFLIKTHASFEQFETEKWSSLCNAHFANSVVDKRSSIIHLSEHFSPTERVSSSCRDDCSCLVFQPISVVQKETMERKICLSNTIYLTRKCVLSFLKDRNKRISKSTDGTMVHRSKITVFEKICVISEIQSNCWIIDR